MKSARFSPKPASILDTISVLNILNNVRNLQTSTKDVLSERDCRLLIIILFAYISYLVLHYMWGVLIHAYTKDTILHTSVIITAVSK